MVVPAEVSEYLCQSNSSDDRNNFDMVDALGEDDNDENSENRDKMLLQNELNNLSNQSSDQALKKKLHLSLSKLKCESQMQQNINGGCCLSNRIIHNQKVILNSARNLFNQNATQNHLSMLASLNNLSPTNKKQCTVFSSSPRKQKNQPFISNIMNRSFTNMRQKQKQKQLLLKSFNSSHILNSSLKSKQGLPPTVRNHNEQRSSARAVCGDGASRGGGSHRGRGGGGSFNLGVGYAQVGLGRGGVAHLRNCGEVGG
jgi:hypothetical protein